MDKKGTAVRYVFDPISILLIEDNPGDIQLTREALKDAKILNRLYVAQDGEEAMNFLNRKGKYKGAPLPNLILLDINLPRKSGIDVLQEIKADKELSNVPVAILTISTDREDIELTHKLKASRYITKPVDATQLFQIIRFIEDFHFRVVAKIKKV